MLAAERRTGEGTVRAFVLAMAIVTAVVAAGSPSPPRVIQAPPTPVVIGVDLPMQGISADGSADTLAAIRLIVNQAGGVAGAYAVSVKSYDDSTFAQGGWDGATCVANAHAQVANASELAVIGTYNTGCSKLEVPVLNRASDGPMAMISHANTNPGLIRLWTAGEQPGQYYPTGIRSYGRIIASDNFQGTADADFVRKTLHAKRCFIVNDGYDYGVGVARAFATEAKRVHLRIVGDKRWRASASNYRKLWAKAAGKKANCVFLSGQADWNGAQLIKDKVAVLGSNKRVRLLAPDGFTGYPDIDRLKAAQGMYISFSGIPAAVMATKSAVVRQFLAAFQNETGHAMRTTYALYGAAVAQLMMKAIAASDGTRKGVRDQLFSGLKVPAAQSMIDADTGIDPASGEAIAKQITVQVLRHHVEQFYREVDV
jgi:branched-chain amino acid transport system substrate-binding protein